MMNEKCDTLSHPKGAENLCDPATRARPPTLKRVPAAQRGRYAR